VFLALDDQVNSAEALTLIGKVMNGPMSEYILGIKLNDALHADWGGPEFVEEILGTWPDLGVFLDMKLGDVVSTDVNTLKHYADLPMNRLWLTVSLASSTKCFWGLREAYPELWIIGMGVPTDIKVDECIEKHGAAPPEVMDRWINSLFKTKGDGVLPPVSAIIVSEDMLQIAKDKWIPLRIMPGVRDQWMAKDHQERTTGVVAARSAGADLLVMGAQLLKGNPKAETPISALESQALTAAELDRYFKNLERGE